MILEYQSKHGMHCNVVCTEPRRISAISVAERVSEEMDDPFPYCTSKDSLVGYQIRGEKKTTKTTRITYCTTGVLLRVLQSEPTLKQYSHIVVDEVHERSVESDLLLIHLRQILRETSLKVIVMSATIDVNKLSAYFDGAPVLEAGGRTFPVTLFPLEDCVELTQYSCEAESEYALCRSDYKLSRTQKHGRGTLQWEDGTLSDAAYAKIQDLDPAFYSPSTIDTIVRLDESRVNLDLIEALLLLIVRNTPPTALNADHPLRRYAAALDSLQQDPSSSASAILIFLPGLSHIQKLFNLLSHHRLFSDTSKFLLVRLHSALTVSAAEQRLVFEVPAGGVVKIVLATNIAETGVTIPDVVYVIDSGRVKQTGFTVSTQMQCLEETFVSRASLKQRSGRAGRVRPGIAFQLVSSHWISHSSREFTPPEILRVPLENVCIQIMALREMSVWHFLGEALDCPSEKAINAAVAKLHDIGAAYSVSEEVVHLTHLGTHLANFPLDLRVGKMLIYGAIFKCLDPVLTIAASAGNKDIFLKPTGKEMQASEMQKRFLHESSDLISIHNAYRAWAFQRHSGSTGEAFARKHFLSVKALSELRKTKKELLQALISMGFSPKNTPLDSFNDGSYSDNMNINSMNDRLISSVLLSGLYPNVCQASIVKSSKGHSRVVYKCREHEAVLFKGSVNDRSLKNGEIMWLAFLSKLKVGKVTLRDSTLVHVSSLVLFGGPLQIFHQDRHVVVDNWIHFRAHPKVCCIYETIKHALDNHLQLVFENPLLEDDRIVDLIVQLIV